MAKFRIVAAVFLAVFQTGPVLAQGAQILADPGLPDSVIRERVNTGTVTVITGGASGVSNTYRELASDLATVLDVRSELRVLPVIGYGSLQNIEDLLYLRGIDIGMVHSDVMRHIEQRQILPSARRNLRYITKLYDEPLHLLVNSSITDIQQLDGQTVIVGRPGSGNEMSALTLIAELGISPNLIHVPFEEGVEQVRSGEAAGMFVVTRRPATRLREVSAGDSLHFLPIPVTESLAETYEAVQLTSEDYPNLIAEGETIETPQMGAVLAVYNWQPGSPRYANVTAFIAAFTEKLPELREASRKDVWEKLDFAAPVNGWERYEPANAFVEQLVAAKEQDEPALALSDQELAGDEMFRQFDEFMRKTYPDRELDQEEMKKLYARFRLWQQMR